ncbi:MAG: LysR family transcriptional regulator [Acidocella sp.]|nr:LysR family transcriptional regulator [Acidocella sp.]
MDLFRTYENFLHVVKAGSFAAAANQLGVSRSSVSKNIQELENHLGVRLFHRTTRRQSLTTIGENYYGFCQKLLSDIEDKRIQLSNLQKEPRGIIRIMAPKSFGNLYLAPIIAEFIAQYPKLHVSLLLSDDTSNTYDLIDHGVDLAIRLSPSLDSSIITKRIGSLEWILCASPNYIAQCGLPRTPDELKGHNCLIHLKSAPDSVWALSNHNGEISVRVSGSFSTNSSLALQAGVLRGLGIALLPRYCVNEKLHTGELQRVLSDYRFAERPFFVMFPNKRNLSLKVRLMVDYLTQQFSNARPFSQL